MKAVDIKGQRFGRLVALSENGPSKYGRLWKCRCDCGAEVIATANSLKTGNTGSCGCLQRDRTSAASWKHGCSRGRSVEYNTWLCMHHRCRTHPSYHGRGIAVCERWNVFENFLEDMGLRPSSKHSIERTNNDGPYSPENCIWGTVHAQTRNKRTNVWITHLGQSKIASDWERDLGLRQGTVARRMHRGWSALKSITTPTN